MPSSHLILCRPLLLLPSIFPSIRTFSNKSALHIRWPKYWSFSFNSSPSNEHPGLISFRMDWLDLLAAILKLYAAPIGRGFLCRTALIIAPFHLHFCLRWLARHMTGLHLQELTYPSALLLTGIQGHSSGHWQKYTLTSSCNSISKMQPNQKKGERSK